MTRRLKQLFEELRDMDARYIEQLTTDIERELKRKKGYLYFDIGEDYSDRSIGRKKIEIELLEMQLDYLYSTNEIQKEKADEIERRIKNTGTVI